MKTFKQLIVEIANRDPQKGEEFDNYINAMFGDMRGDAQRPWASKPSKRRPSKPKFSTLEQKFEYLKRKAQNAKRPTPLTNESHLSWFRDKIGDHLPYTYGIPTSENMRSINLPVRGVRDHGENFIIDLEADSYAKQLENHDINHIEGLLSHPLSAHEVLGKHLTKIGAIRKGKVGRINFDLGNEWKQDRDPTLSIHISKQHVLDAYNRRTQ